MMLLEKVVGLLRQEAVAEGKDGSFEVLNAFLTFDRGAIPYAHVAAQLRVTEGCVRVAVHRLRRRYRELLRAEIAQTLADASLVDEELRSLLSAFSL